MAAVSVCHSIAYLSNINLEGRALFDAYKLIERIKESKTSSEKDVKYSNLIREVSHQEGGLCIIVVSDSYIMILFPRLIT